MTSNNLDEAPFFSFKLNPSTSFQFPNLNIDSTNSEHLTPNVNFNSSDVFVKSNPQFNFGFESLNALTLKGKPKDSEGFNFNLSLPPLVSNTAGMNFTFDDSSSLTGTSTDTTIPFRETLAENPLIKQSATNILEQGFIATDKNTKSTIQETINLIKGNHAFDYVKARSTAYDANKLKAPSQQSYHTALLDQHLAEDVLAGVIFKGSNNAFIKELTEKYANDMGVLTRSEVSARERYIAVSKALQEKLGLAAGADPLSILTKDIISKAGEIKVQERDAKGEIIKVDGKPKEIILTTENFERYLDDPALQKALNKEINKRTYYQNNNYRTIIDNYRAKNPDVAPEAKVAPASTAKLPEATRKKFEELANEINGLRRVQDGKQALDLLKGSGKQDKQKNSLITDTERKTTRRGWGDYKEIKWDGSHGNVLTESNKALINKLYSENIKEGVDVKHLDQFTSLMVTLVNKAKDKTITNEEVEFLKKINIESDWKPEGGSSQKIATTIITFLKKFEQTNGPTWN